MKPKIESDINKIDKFLGIMISKKRTGITNIRKWIADITTNSTEIKRKVKLNYE